MQNNKNTNDDGRAYRRTDSKRGHRAKHADTARKNARQAKYAAQGRGGK
jgi:hypothetical protein